MAVFDGCKRTPYGVVRARTSGTSGTTYSGTPLQVYSTTPVFHKFLGDGFDDEDFDLNEQEQFTCTCGLRFNTARNLQIHRYTTKERTQPHQRCSTELPVAGGAYVIIDMRTMRPLAAELVDCTVSGCNLCSSTQAETLTAIYGLRRLMSLNLSDKVVETYCDNAALLQRSLKLRDQLLSRRQIIKMSDLDLSQAFCDTSAKLEALCHQVIHHWRGAEHNLAYYADRELEDIGNLIADYFADIAAATSAKQSGIYARVYTRPNIKRTPTEIRVNKTMCTQPLTTVFKDAMEAQSQAALRCEPHGNDETTSPQYHQHVAHAANDEIDFKSLKLALVDATDNEVDALDRHTLDATKVREDIICSELTKQDRGFGKQALKLLQDKQGPNGEISHNCLLCSSHYGNKGGRAARHLVHDCKFFKSQRGCLDATTTALLYQAGSCFHGNPAASVGLLSEKVTAPALDFDSMPSDRYLRVLVDDEDLGHIAQHKFSQETLLVNWANRWIGKEISVNVEETANAYAELARKKAMGEQWDEFVCEMVNVSKYILKNEERVMSIQPEPAVAKWLQNQYGLQSQHDCTPFNCSHGIFPTTPRISATITVGQTDVLKRFGMRPGLQPSAEITESCLLSIETRDKNWKARLQAAARSVHNNQDITVVCMVVFNGVAIGGDRKELRTLSNALNGIEILDCPQDSLTVREPCGHKENADPSVRLRTSDDFRQKGHAAETKPANNFSYRLGSNMNIEGPRKTNLVRHKYSGCRDEIKFVVFRSKTTAGELLKEAAESIPTLCESLANTNANLGKLWGRREIHWTAGQRIELSVQHMLHKSTRAKKCLAAFHAATRSKIDDGAYYENRIKPGYTSSASLLFLENIGLPITDARTILAAIARAEMHFLHTIEQAGVARILSKLESLGVPMKRHHSPRRVRTCEAADCTNESTTLYVMGGEADHRTAKKPAVCIVCVTNGGDNRYVQRQLFTTRAGRESRPSAKSGVRQKSVSRTAGSGNTDTAAKTLARTMAATGPHGKAPHASNLRRTISAERRSQAEAEIDAAPKIGDTWQHGKGEKYKVTRLTEDKGSYVLTPFVDLGKDEIAIEINLGIDEFNRMRKTGKGRAAEGWRCIHRIGSGVGHREDPTLKRQAGEQAVTDVSETDDENNIGNSNGPGRQRQRRRKAAASNSDED